MLVAGALLVVLLHPLGHAVSLALHGNFNKLRRDFRGLGAGGLVLLLGLMLVHAVIFYPTELVTATAGFVYGFLPGLGLAAGGWLVSGLLAYFLGRTLARPLLIAVFGKTRFTGLERAIEVGGIPLLLGCRLIPVVPYGLLCYAAGAAGVRLWRYTWTTFIGFLPQTAAVAYVGSHARSLSLSNPLIWFIAAAVISVLAISRLAARGRVQA